MVEINKKNKTITQTFYLNDIKGFTYDERTNNCTFIYNNRIISGKLVLFEKVKGKLLIQKEL